MRNIGLDSKVGSGGPAPDTTTERHVLVQIVRFFRSEVWLAGRVCYRRPATRAVQRSIYDTHSEDGTDAAKGDAMASVCDIVNAIEAQDVGGERAQACKDAGIASDAAGVFCEATVADVVRAVLDAPVVADGLGALSGRQHDVTDEQCGFAG